MSEAQKSVAAHNIEYFNKLADTYDERPDFAEAIEIITNAIRDNLDFIGAQWAKQEAGENVRMLDYACGTGSATRALGPYVDVIRGIDISPNMVAQYNKRARAAGINQDIAYAEEGDLTAETADTKFQSEAWKNFDIVALVAGLHHMENISRTVDRLSERLKPGGVLFIVDLDVSHGHESHLTEDVKAKHGVTVEGFTAAKMEKLFSGSKLDKIGYKVVDKPIIIRRGGPDLVTTRWFMARAAKAGA